MDVFDKAQERDRQQLEEALKWQRAKAAATPALTPTGCCHNPRCADDIAPEKIFCNNTCAAEYARLTRGK